MQEHDPSATGFGRAAVRLVSALEAHGRDAVAPDDYRLVLATLARYAHGSGLSEVDAEEVAAEALAETFIRGTDRTKKPIRQPVGYLFWTTRNRVVDRHRRTRLRNETEFGDDAEAYGQRYYSREDDAIAQLLDRDASAEGIEDALRAAKAADDTLVNRVVIAWLALAEQRRGAPSTRDVGELAGVSHTSVRQAMQRFRSYFPKANL